MPCRDDLDGDGESLATPRLWGPGHLPRTMAQLVYIAKFWDTDKPGTWYNVDRHACRVDGEVPRYAHSLLSYTQVDWDAPKLSG